MGVGKSQILWRSINMASKTVKIEMECPNCGKIYEADIEREALFERDRRGVGRLDVGVYVFNGSGNRREFVNCDCGNTLIVKKVRTALENPVGLEFCKECGTMIDSKIANGDELCPKCD